MLRFLTFLTLFSIIASTFPALPAADDLPGLRVPDKKIISFGWDHPSPAVVKANLAKLEATLFDGFGIELPIAVAGGKVFRPDLWDKVTDKAKKDLLQEMADLPMSKSLSDNFVVMYGESSMEWTSDADWKRVQDQLRFCARAAKAGRCKGMLWDPEPYAGRNPWEFRVQPDAKGKDFAKFTGVVKRRAEQFQRALQEEFPGLVILSLRQLSDFQNGPPFSGRLFGETDRAKRSDILRNSYWSLNVPFTEGLLVAMADDVVLHDGNEDAYYYSTSLEFYRLSTQLRVEGALMVSPAIRKKYDAHYKVGHAVAADFIDGRWKDHKSLPKEMTRQAAELTPVQRAQWFEHNVYHALASSDRYIWVYGEDMSWWKDRNLPEGYAAALKTAKDKQRRGLSLGFEVQAMLKKAREDAKDKLKNK